MEQQCENCGASVPGEDPDDNPGYLVYTCQECGRYWDSDGNVWEPGDKKKEGMFFDDVGNNGEPMPRTAENTNEDDTRGER